MTITRLRTCVEQGLCTWEQVRQTLVNARLTDAEIARYMEGRLPLGAYGAAMLRELVASGQVPSGPANVKP